MRSLMQKYSNSVVWNLILLTTGCFLIVLSINGLTVPHHFIPTGLSGACVFISYIIPSLSPSFLYGAISIVLFIAGFFVLGRKFLLYSIYGSVLVTLFLKFLHYNIPIQDPLLAAIASGIILGLGSGIVLHSRGCDGGLTIIGIILFEKLHIKIGKFFLIFNMCLFSIAAFFIPLDNIMYSLIMVYTFSTVMHSVQTMFNQNKFVFIISSHSHQIAETLMSRLGQGVTYLHGEGAFTHKPTKIIITAVQSAFVKKMETLILKIDPQAFIVIEDTFDVIGAAFKKIDKYK